ncbi:MAG: hypothetical protein JSW67_11600 [Candidatus Latescibacterota bacterium]|nr:MAG: hypothetical protein JSW67_11600 [Candidatus Latescibacterota bacterium]
MKKSVWTGLVALSLLISVGVASADIDIELEIDNKTTKEKGKSVSASPGDLVRITARLINLSGETLAGDIVLVAGIPGCMIEETLDFSLRKNQRRQRFVQDRVPAGHTGPLTVDVSVDAGSCSDSDFAIMTFATNKPNAADHASVFERIFVRMLARSLAVGLASDHGPVTQAIGFSELKALYR